VGCGFPRARLNPFMVSDFWSYHIGMDLSTKKEKIRKGVLWGDHP